MASHGDWKPLGDGSLTTQDADVGLGHIVSSKVSFNTLLALVVLTVVTVYTAKYVDLGTFNIVLAMILATIKATLVGTYFMHLKFEGKLIIAYVIYPLIILALLLLGTFMDIADRHSVQSGNVLENVKAPTAEATEKKAH